MSEFDDDNRADGKAHERKSLSAVRDEFARALDELEERLQYTLDEFLDARNPNRFRNLVCAQCGTTVNIKMNDHEFKRARSKHWTFYCADCGLNLKNEKLN